MIGELGGGGETGLGAEFPGAGTDLGAPSDLGIETPVAELPDLGIEAEISGEVVSDSIPVLEAPPVEAGAEIDSGEKHIFDSGPEPSIEGEGYLPSEPQPGEASPEAKAGEETSRFETTSEDAPDIGEMNAPAEPLAEPPLSEFSEQPEPISELSTEPETQPAEVSEPPLESADSPQTDDGVAEPSEGGSDAHGEEAPIEAEANELGEETAELPETGGGPTESGEVGPDSRGEEVPTEAKANELGEETSELSQTGGDATELGEAGPDARGEEAPTEAKANEPGKEAAEPPQSGHSSKDPSEAERELRDEDKPDHTKASEARETTSEASEQSSETAPENIRIGEAQEDFAAMKAAAEKSAFGSINKEQILDAIDKADKGLSATSEIREPDARHVRGFLGEEGAAQQAQRTGGMVVIAKTSFSDTTKGGIDLGELREGQEGLTFVKGDNKVQNTNDTVYSVSALDKNDAKNEAAVLNKATDMERTGTLEADRLVGGASREAIEAGRTEKEVTNVGAMGVGAQGVSDKLEGKGIGFRDMAGEMADAAKNSRVVPERLSPRNED